MELIDSKREDIVNFFIGKGMFLGPEFLDYIKDNKIVEHIHKFIKEKGDAMDIEVLSQELLNMVPTVSKQDTPESQTQESSNADLSSSNSVIVDAHTEPIINPENTNVIVNFSYDEKPKKKAVGDFFAYFRTRFKAMESMLRGRVELQNVVSINRVVNKKERENISLIGMVNDKNITKNGNYILTLEDLTGSIKILINKNKPELIEIVKDIMLDEIIGINGSNGDNIVFVDNLLLPDVPLTKEFKKAPYESYILFLSDWHVGSTYFLEDKFLRFIKWISGKSGSDKQREMASKVSHICVMGDIVDGIGIYPGQESELEITDITEQYEKCAEYIKMIPKHIKIIISSGNHDAMRIAEPQPALYEDYAASIYELPNVIMVSNPAIVNLGKTEVFNGFDILLYHGYSFDYYFKEVESIRNNGGYDRADLMMQFLLQRRHLAPSYTSTLFLPTPEVDNLIISKIPDVFATGHVHKTTVSSYRNVTLISGSCWQSTTPFQIKVGHNPEPARVPIMNTQTREVKILKF